MRIPTFIRPQIAGFVFALSVVASMAVSGLAHAETQFTIGAIPDTQQEVVRANDTLLPDRYTWLVNNRSNLNLKYLTHSGDVVNWGNQEPIQFVRASDATNILDGSGIPYAYALGNHDTGAVAVGGSAAPGNTRLNLRNTEPFNNAFPLSRFKNVGGTYELGKVDNLYQTFSAGGIDWLNITLEMWPRQGVVDWAKQVVTSHPHHNVIITTHAFADATGIFPTTGFYGDTTAQSLWNQLVSQYPNIKMVISGHYRGAHYSERTGVNGNKIPLIMTAYHADYQNHVRLLTVNTANGTISSRVYVSTSLNGQPNGEIVDQYSNFVTTGMNWIQPENSDPQPPVITVPDAPTAVTATAGNASATVSFTPPANNGGAPISSYTVTSTPGNITATGSGSPITVNGLTNGVSYTFAVKANNSAGSGIAAFTTTAVTPVASTPVTELLSDPGFESGLGGWQSFIVGNLNSVNTPVRSGSKALSIAAVSTSTNYVGMTHNSVITNSVAGRQYTAQCYVRPVSAAANVQIRFLEYNQSWGNGVTLQTTTTSGVPAGQWTLVKVTATANSSGDRIIPQIYATNQTTNSGNVIYDDCSVSYGTPAPVITVPSAPTNVTAVADDSEATVSFTPPTNNGGASVTSYTVTSNPGNITVTDVTSPIMVGGLTNGVSYTFTVTATNVAGTSGVSSASNAVVPATIPGMPMALAAVAGNGKVDLNWTAPADDGGAVVTDYLVSYREAGSSDWLAYNDGVSAEPIVTVSGLSNDTSYEFSVQAVNRVGTSELSELASATPVAPPATSPAVPTSVSGTAGNSQVSLSWNAPISDGGADITDYVIEYSVSGSGVWTVFDDGVSTSTHAIITGLTNGTTYIFTVRAQNSVGSSAASSASANVTPRTTPDAPSSVTAVAGNGSVIVSFTAPSNNGGAAITGYTVTSTPGNVTVSGSGSPITVNGLMNGMAYTFTVRANNSAGSSVASAASNSVTPAAPINELLADPGFENGLGGWASFIVGNLSQITTPVRSGTKALKITATSTTANWVGMTNNNVVPNSVAGKTYTAQCYVRPTSGTLNVQIRFLQYTQNYSSNTNLGTVTVSAVPSTDWTLVKVTGVATASGMRIIPQIYATNQTTLTGALQYDDCSVTVN